MAAVKESNTVLVSALGVCVFVFFFQIDPDSCSSPGQGSHNLVGDRMLHVHVLENEKSVSRGGAKFISSAVAVVVYYGGP